MTTMKNEFFLLSRAIVTAGVWIAYGLSNNDWVLTAAVAITIVTGLSSET